MEREAVQRTRARVPRAEVPERRAAERLFHRDLPGGGYVAIDVAERGRPEDRAVRIIVERRGDRTRRLGHRPPVIREERWGPAGGDGEFGELFRLANDNAAIARELMRLRAD